jgi:pilus assembly protein CpaB
MNSNRGIVMLLVALIAGVVAVVMAARWIQQQNKPSGGRIAVAQLDVQLAPHHPEMIQLVEQPAAACPMARSTTGRRRRSCHEDDLQRGELVLESKLAPLGTKGDCPRWSATASAR